jgi:dimethylamine--corrinoid protein Co-methyltransferase
LTQQSEVMPVEAKVPTRMGDGFMVEMTRSELRADIEAATDEAARKAKAPPLTADEQAHLLDIYASPAAFTAVDIGDQVVLSCDGGGSKMTGTDLQDLLESEQRLGQDLLELWHIEYSYKAIKTILPFQQQLMQNAQLMLTAPIQYGAQPNLAFYSKPDGPADNWFELLPRGDIAGARAAIEEAMEHATKDFVYVGEGMLDAGADGMDFDTTGGAGDADLYSTLRAVKHLRAKYPEAGIEVGTAGEFVIGVHGELEWEGRRLAGLWPKGQLEVCQDAGATIFGPAVNIRTTKSCAWNTAYSLTVIKPCMEAARIPVHVNVGQGVCGVPVNGYPGEDASSRAAKAHVEILRCDGL